MGSLEQATWVSLGKGTTRRQRKSGTYFWYRPTKLADLNVALDADVVGDVSAAERALAVTDAESSRGTEGIARLLLRSEAVASSHIEGLVIGPKRLIRAELNELEPGSVRYDQSAAQVLGNIHALERSVVASSVSTEITVDMLLEIHRVLCEGTDIERYGGVIRETQNWVGGGNYNPFDAIYVPPAPELVPGLLQDIVDYANRTDISPVVQAALCHSQFETVHPFADGNGRTGRALIQLMLKRSGVVKGAIPPISLALATDKAEYEHGLYAMQHWVTDEEGHEAVNEWVSTFAGAVVQACEDRRRIEAELTEMRGAWEAKLGRRPRANSALALLLPEVQAMPIFTVETMVRATGRSFAAVNNAVAALVQAGVVEETTKGKRSRVFQAPDVLEEFQLVERRMASPERDTLVEQPVRPVPAWKKGQA